MRHTLLRHLRLVILAISLPVVALLIVAVTGGVTAFASSSDGAQHIVGSTCVPDNPGSSITDCFTIDALVQDTTTPSGNVSESSKVTETYTQYDSGGNVLDSYSQTVSGHVITKQGETHEYAEDLTVSETFSGASCSETVYFHFANGAVQFDRESGTC